MAIVDTTSPKQRVSCDLCATEFDRVPRKSPSSFGGYWEDISIAVYPSIQKEDELGFGGSGSVRIDHACIDCRKKFLESARTLIDSMNTKGSAIISV